MWQANSFQEVRSKSRWRTPSSVRRQFMPGQRAIPWQPTILIQRACACGGACPRCAGDAVHPKLTVGSANDPLEHEADRVADQVMRMPDSSVQRASATDEEEELCQPKLLAGENVSQVQRQAEPEEEEEDELVQTKPLADQITPLVQRQVEPEEDEEIVQTKDNGENTPCARHDLQAQVRSLRGVGQPLPKTVRNFFEPRFGCDFSQVRVHTGPEANLLSHQLGAKAFTTARDVFFREGAYQPDTDAGKGLLAHELAHVVHQAGAGDLIQRQGVNAPLTQEQRYLEVLKQSRIKNRIDWERDIQQESFLGIRIANGVHKQLKNQLRSAEKYLRKQGLTAKSLNISRITGHRKPTNANERTSFHNFGLAIDIDSWENPWVGRSDTTRKIIHQIIRRATFFMYGFSLNLGRPDRLGPPNLPIGEQYDKLEMYSRALEFYFDKSFRNSNGKEEVEKALKESKITTGPNGETALSLDDITDLWHKQIKQDYKNKDLTRELYSGRLKRRRDPAEGIMRLDRRLVMALVNQGQLRWGGQWTTSKDIMHFDWRGGTIKEGTIRQVNSRRG